MDTVSHVNRSVRPRFAGLRQGSQNRLGIGLVASHIIGGDDPIPPEALELLKLTEQQIEQLVVELPAQLEVAELMLSSA